MHMVILKSFKEKLYLGKTNDPTARLFSQFHAPQTNEMKKSIIRN